MYNYIDSYELQLVVCFVKEIANIIKIKFILFWLKLVLDLRHRVQFLLVKYSYLKLKQSAVGTFRFSQASISIIRGFRSHCG